MCCQVNILKLHTVNKLKKIETCIPIRNNITCKPNFAEVFFMQPVVLCLKHYNSFQHYLTVFLKKTMGLWDCINTPPTPVALASTIYWKIVSPCGNAKHVALVKVSLSCWKALLINGFQVIGQHFLLPFSSK